MKSLRQFEGRLGLRYIRSLDSDRSASNFERDFDRTCRAFFLTYALFVRVQHFLEYWNNPFKNRDQAAEVRDNFLVVFQDKLRGWRGKLDPKPALAPCVVTFSH